MRILIDNGSLLIAIPNYVCQGLGERTLFDKIKPFVDSAENWLESYIVPWGLLEELPGDSPLMVAARRAVAYQALRLAAPALDVTMHPNGLAVVSTDSLAPASAERSREFRDMLDDMTLRYVDELLELLKSLEGWNRSRQACEFWLLLPFRDCDSMLSYIPVNRDWKSFHQAAKRVIELTELLSGNVVSDEIMARICRTDETDRKGELARLAMLVRGFIAAEFNRTGDGERFVPRMVEILRKDFPEWENSPQGELFSPPVFRNEKRSGGYFF